MGMFVIFQYSGKNQARGVEYGLGEGVVHSLSECLVTKEYKIYADNFFSSIPMAKSPAEKGLDMMEQ